MCQTAPLDRMAGLRLSAMTASPCKLSRVASRPGQQPCLRASAGVVWTLPGRGLRLLALQLRRKGPTDWLIFTLGQGTGYLSSRNELIDRLESGFTPRRDLIPEIGRQLHQRGKRMINYLPGANTAADATVKRLTSHSPRQASVATKHISWGS
jgi:hypothetical protein